MTQFDWKLAWHLLTAIVAIVLATSYLLRSATNKPKSQKSSGSQTNGLKPPNPEVALPASYSHLHIFDRAAVCADSHACSNIGSNMLQKHNGSAVDATIATLLCNGLITMQSMGLGGGMLMQIYSQREHQAYSVLSREAAPRNIGDIRQLLSDKQQLHASPLAIGVPGELMGYAVAHQRFGRLPWATLVQPTIKICRNGYRLSKHQRDSLHTNKEQIMQDPHLSSMFVDATTGDLHRVDKFIYPVPELCQTYEMLAKEGPFSFYNGSLAQLVTADLQDLNSTVRLTDLFSYQAQLVPALTLPLGNFNLHLTPPPGSGYIVGFIMNVLQNFAKDFQAEQDLGNRDIQRIVEALKFGFVQRWSLDVEADDELLANLSSLSFARQVARRISLVQTFKDPIHYGAKPKLKSRPEQGTAHISVMAPDGDAVSVTSSINYYFGVGRTGPRTGIIFNNALTDFNIAGLRNYFQLPNQQNVNQLKPLSRPMSSMSPLIVSDSKTGEARLAIGAAGGTKIISVLTQILVRTLWLKHSIKQAIDAPRVHHQMLPNQLEYEYGILQSMVDEMERLGHKTRRYRERGSVVCGLEKIDGVVYGNADYRKEGGVSGF